MNIISIRIGMHKHVFNSYVWSNPKLLGSFAVSLMLVAFVIYVPSVSYYFGFGPLTTIDWLLPIAVAVIYLFGRELWKRIFYKPSLDKIMQ